MQTTTTNNPTLSVRRIVITGILGAISILLGATTFGFIPIPNLSGSATIMHVPVIIGAVLEGPVVGLLVGLIFGIFSFLQAQVPFFKDPLVSVIPRLFIGPFAYFAYVGLKTLLRNRSEYSALVGAAVVGTLTNTILVVGMIVLRWASSLAESGLGRTAFIASIIPQAVAEVIIASVITVAVVAAWKRIDTGRGGSSV